MLLQLQVLFQFFKPDSNIIHVVNPSSEEAVTATALKTLKQVVPARDIPTSIAKLSQTTKLSTPL
jgi:hypothetical protein